MQFIYNDGGREKAGRKGEAGDCVVRAIAIATEKPYIEVYNALMSRSRTYATVGRCRVARRIREKGSSPRNGVFDKIWVEYLFSLGWVWTPTMFVGKGCKVHLRADELPRGRVVCKVSGHVCAVIDGVLHDNHDCTREGTRCVYGYFTNGT